MNHRTFLRLLTATAAAAVAGLRPRPEPTEVVTGSRWITSPEIVMTDYGRIVTNATGTSWTALVPSDLLDDTQFDLQAYIEAEIYGQLIDHELLEGATGPVLGVISCA